MHRYLFVLLLASTASAERRPTFMATTTYMSCHKETMFACGKIDAAGHRYGTAHEVERCESYVFHPDGTFVARGLPNLEGTYRIFAGKLKMTFEPAFEGDKPHTTELVLSPDGTLLGEMKRVVSKQ
jgi:hypothetical protein